MEDRHAQLGSINEKFKYGKKNKKIIDPEEIESQINSSEIIYSLGIDSLYKKYSKSSPIPSLWDINTRNTPFDYDYFLKYYYSIDSIEKYTQWHSKLDHKEISFKRTFNAVMIAYGHSIVNYNDNDLDYFYRNFMTYWISKDGVSPDKAMKKIPATLFIETLTKYIVGHNDNNWDYENHYHALKMIYRKLYHA
jgi:hypothetical protein